MKINDFRLLGPYWEASWKRIGALWRHIGPSGDHLERLGTIFRRLGAVLGRLESFWGASWLIVGPANRHSGADDPPRLGGLLRRLGTSDARKREKGTNREKNNENQ